MQEFRHVIALTKQVVRFIISFVLFTSISCEDKKQVDVDTVKGRWTTDRINAWYREQPWLVSCNYYPQTAINQIEIFKKLTRTTKK